MATTGAVYLQTLSLHFGSWMADIACLIMTLKVFISNICTFSALKHGKSHIELPLCQYVDKGWNPMVPVQNINCFEAQVPLYE